MGAELFHVNGEYEVEHCSLSETECRLGQHFITEDNASRYRDKKISAYESIGSVNGAIASLACKITGESYAVDVPMTILTEDIESDLAYGVSINGDSWMESKRLWYYRLMGLLESRGTDVLMDFLVRLRISRENDRRQQDYSLRLRSLASNGIAFTDDGLIVRDLMIRRESAITHFIRVLDDQQECWRNLEGYEILYSKSPYRLDRANIQPWDYDRRYVYEALREHDYSNAASLWAMNGASWAQDLLYATGDALREDGGISYKIQDF